MIGFSLALAAATVTIRADTPVPLIVDRDVSSETIARGDRVPLHLAADLIVDGVTMIAADAAALGQVTVADRKGAYGRGGRIVVSLLYLRDRGRTIRLRGDIEASGGGHDLRLSGRNVFTAATAVAITGSRATIAAGTRVTGYVLHDVVIDGAEAE